MLLNCLFGMIVFLICTTIGAIIHFAYEDERKEEKARLPMPGMMPVSENDLNALMHEKIRLFLMEERKKQRNEHTP